MTENKFTIILDYDDEIGVKENHSGDVIVLNHRDLNSEQFVAQLVMFLNEQNDAIDKLINDEKYWEEKAIERITWLEKENNELKEKNEQLKQSNEYLQGQLDDYSGVEVDNIELRNENEQLKQQVTHLTMYKNLFREFQKQLDGVKKKSDLDSKDFEDLIELTKGHVFDDEHDWIHLPVNDR